MAEDKKESAGLKTLPMFANVKQIVKPIEGFIIRGRLADDGESIEYTVRHRAEHNGEWRDTHFNSRDLDLVSVPSDAEKLVLQEQLLTEQSEQHASDVAAGAVHEAEAK